MHSPERILEALAWLYGGEWKQSGQAFSSDERGDVWNDNGCWTWSNGDWGSNTSITAEVAHALAVTAPWEWVEKVATFECRCDKFDAAVWPARGGDGWKWQVAIIPECHEIVSYKADPCPDMDAAQSAARAAYLTWTRGRLALRGLEK